MAHESASAFQRISLSPYYMYSFICPPPCTDPTLNINNLRQVTASVENWYDLGHYYVALGVPEAVCEEIRTNTAYQTEEEKKEALLLYYLQNVPMASWAHLAGALHHKKEKTASQAVKEFLKDTPAGLSCNRICMWMCDCHL